MLKINPGHLTHPQLARFYESREPIELPDPCWDDVQRSRDVVEKLIQRGDTVYGLNTGFGLLADQKISAAALSQLQLNLVRSHSAGTGSLIEDRIVRLIMVLKLASLARGYSGVRREVIEILMACLNADILPCIPEQGSVGASGDLAPLAHLSLALIGEGEVRQGEHIVSAASALAANQVAP